MKNQYGLCKSERSRKQILFRRAAMLIVFGFFFWQIAEGLLASSTSVVSAMDGCGNDVVAGFCEKNTFGFMVRDFVQYFSVGDIAGLENALLFGQAPCR
ncbi:MAG: hypothetical protein QM483_10225 [Desulfuromusa sp.]